MKRRVFTIVLFLGLGLSSIWAEDNQVNGTTNSVRTIKSPRFARPLVEKWIEEYAKTEPGVVFQLVQGSGNQDNIDLLVEFDNQEKDGNNFSHIVFFGETAVLPITARSSEAARLLEGKHLNSKKLKQLFFLNDDLDEEVKKNKVFESITIYSGSNASSVASSFAHHFSEESANFRGKRIAGDDLFLNTAIAKDPLGVTFNTLSNIFDLESRQLKSELSLVSLDLKKELESSFNENGTLDDVLNTLESSKSAEVAIEKVGITINNPDEAVNRFLQWVLENGTKYNHEYGFLNLDNKEAKAQINQVNNVLTAQK
jgi:ABC-type phosphate transport system substrate-binding protein